MIKGILNSALQPKHRALVTSLLNANLRYLSLLEQYEQRVATGAIVNDFEQRSVIFSLNELMRNINRWYNTRELYSFPCHQKLSIFSHVLKRIYSIPLLRKKNPVPKGVYIYGDVGMSILILSS